ncbi:hypothetical protein BDV09DRAFT_179948, partial [Aspergillus tetrazonus]
MRLIGRICLVLSLNIRKLCVKYASIRRLLNAENMRKWRCSWRPYLTEENAL